MQQRHTREERQRNGWKACCQRHAVFPSTCTYPRSSLFLILGCRFFFPSSLSVFFLYVPLPNAAITAPAVADIPSEVVSFYNRHIRETEGEDEGGIVRRSYCLRGAHVSSLLTLSFRPSLRRRCSLMPLSSCQRRRLQRRRLRRPLLPIIALLAF